MGTALLALAAAMSLLGCGLLEQPASDQRATPADARFESPDAGIALTFPDGWLLEPTPSIDLTGVASSLDPESRAMLAPVAAAVPAHRHDRCLVVDASAMVRSWSDRPELADVVDAFEASLRADRRWAGLESTLVDLPGGSAGRILRDRVGESESASIWILTQADAWFYLECITHSRLSEDWRSIARTFEFLPATEAATSAAPVVP